MANLQANLIIDFSITISNNLPVTNFITKAATPIFNGTYETELKSKVEQLQTYILSNNINTSNYVTLSQSANEINSLAASSSLSASIKQAASQLTTSFTDPAAMQELLTTINSGIPDAQSITDVQAQIDSIPVETAPVPTASLTSTNPTVSSTINDTIAYGSNIKNTLSSGLKTLSSSLTSMSASITSGNMTASSALASSLGAKPKNSPNPNPTRENNIFNNMAKNMFQGTTTTKQPRQSRVNKSLTTTTNASSSATTTAPSNATIINLINSLSNSLSSIQEPIPNIVPTSSTSNTEIEISTSINNSKLIVTANGYQFSLLPDTFFALISNLFMQFKLSDNSIVLNDLMNRFGIPVDSNDDQIWNTTLCWALTYLFVWFVYESNPDTSKVFDFLVSKVPNKNLLQYQNVALRYNLINTFGNFKLVLEQIKANSNQKILLNAVIPQTIPDLMYTGTRYEGTNNDYDKSTTLLNFLQTL